MALKPYTNTDGSKPVEAETRAIGSPAYLMMTTPPPRSHTTSSA